MDFGSYREGGISIQPPRACLQAHGFGFDLDLPSSDISVQADRLRPRTLTFRVSIIICLVDVRQVAFLFVRHASSRLGERRPRVVAEGCGGIEDWGLFVLPLPRKVGGQ